MNQVAQPKARERKSFDLLALLLFCIVASLVMMKSARDALTLSAYSYRILPYFMVAATVAVAIVTSIYLRIYSRFTLSTAVFVSFLVFSAVTYGIWVLLGTGHSWAIPVLYIWVSVFAMLAPVQIWSLASQSLTSREVKRSIGLLGGGGIAGSIAGGFAARVIAAHHVSDLLVSALILMLIPAAASFYFRKAVAAPEEEMHEAQAPKTPRRFVFWVLVIIVLSTLASTFIDFQFKVMAQKELKSAYRLARFFGYFYAYLGIATLFFQLIFTPFLLKKLRLPVTLAILPIALLAGNVGFLMVATWFAAVAAKSSEQLVKHSLERSALEVLYIAIPADMRVRLKSLIDSVGNQGAEAVAAVILVALYSLNDIPLRTISMVSIAICGAWAIATIYIGREYPQLLHDTIEQPNVDIEQIKAELFSAQGNHLMTDLKAVDESTLIDVLELIESSDQRGFGVYLESLLHHGRPEIRLKTIRLLFRQDLDASSRVRKLLKDNDRGVRIEAAHYICSKTPANKTSPKKNQALLRDPDPAIQAAACSALLLDTRETVRENAHQQLMKLIKNSRDKSEPEVRVEISHVLEYAPHSRYAEELQRELLFDPEPEIRRSILRAIGKSCSPELIPNLLESLRDPFLRNDVIKTISCYGEKILPHVAKILERKNEGRELCKQALKVAAEVGEENALQIILGTARGSDLVLRFSAIKAMNHLRKQKSLEGWKSTIEDLLEKEVEMLERQQLAAMAFNPRPGGLMDGVLRQRKFWSRQRVFRLLGLIYQPDSIYQAYLGVISSDHKRAGAALELLDASLSPEHRHRIIPVLETEDLSRSTSSIDPVERSKALLDFLNQQDPLLASAAITDLDSAELKEWKAQIWEHLSELAQHPLVHDTLLWKYSKMENPVPQTRPLGTIQKLEYLNKVDIFQELGPHELLLLADQSIEVKYESGEIIFSEGEVARSIFCLVRGSVELRRESGHQATIQAGESFGTLAALTRRPRLFSASAAEFCICLKLERDVFWEILEDYPTICQGIFEVLVQRIDSLTDAGTPTNAVTVAGS